VLQADGYLGYFSAVAFLLSPLDKVTVSLINFSELTELLGSLVKGTCDSELNFPFSLYIFKDFRGVKIICR